MKHSAVKFWHNATKSYIFPARDGGNTDTPTLGVDETVLGVNPLFLFGV